MSSTNHPRAAPLCRPAALAGLLALCLAGRWALADEALPSPQDMQAAGLVIGEITIDNQNIFDLDDPEEDKGLFRLANRLHYRTRPQVVRDQLLFHTGDRYSARVLEESERILRSARYVYDASVRAVAVHDGRVDVAVTTRDVWTLNPGVSFGRRGGKNTGGFELEELNLLGTGIALSAGHKTEPDRDSTIFELKDRHVGRSWWALNAQYASNSDGLVRGLALERPFYALDSRWAAGVNVLDDDRIDSLYDRGEIVDEFRHRGRFAEVYGGWSGGLDNGWVRRWRVGATYQDDAFAAAPVWTGVTTLPADRKWFYPWFEFDLIQDDYRKLTNRDQIERTEDFYLGARASLKLGWADQGLGSTRSALMINGSFGHGVALSDRSTLVSRVDVGGRLESGVLRDAVLDGAVRYYNQQSSRFLFFATLEGAYGHALDLDHPLLLGGDNGLRGYPLRYQSGDRRVLITLEQRYFSDWYPLRLFRVGAAAFIDVGRTWGDAPLGTPSLGLLKDVGFGLRFGSSRSGLGNIIHVDVAFPLDGDPSIRKVQFLVETKERF
jgi:outer membrane protein assembly factor BamA